MGPMKEHPRYHVVSVRINDLEKAILTSISLRSKSSLSDMCRDALYANFFDPAGFSRQEEIRASSGVLPGGEVLSLLTARPRMGGDGRGSRPGSLRKTRKAGRRR